MSYPDKKSKFEKGNEIRFRQNQIELEKQKYDSALVKTAVIATGAVTLDLLTQKAYAQAWGSQTDGFEDSIWNANNMFSIRSGILNNNDEYSGFLHFRSNEGEPWDSILTAEYPGEQTLIAKFSDITPDNLTEYGIRISDLSVTDYARLSVFNWDNALYYNFWDEGGLDLWEPITLRGPPHYLKLEKNSINTVRAYVSRDGTTYTEINGGSTGVPENTAGSIGGAFISATYEVQEFNFSGPQVPNKNNEASQAPMELDLGILTGTLLAYGIIKLKRKFLK